MGLFDRLFGNRYPEKVKGGVVYKLPDNISMGSISLIRETPDGPPQKPPSVIGAEIYVKTKTENRGYIGYEGKHTIKIMSPDVRLIDKDKLFVPNGDDVKFYCEGQLNIGGTEDSEIHYETNQREISRSTFELTYSEIDNVRFFDEVQNHLPRQLYRIPYKDQIGIREEYGREYVVLKDWRNKDMTEINVSSIVEKENEIFLRPALLQQMVDSDKVDNIIDKWLKDPDRELYAKEKEIQEQRRKAPVDVYLPTEFADYINVVDNDKDKSIILEGPYKNTLSNWKEVMGDVKNKQDIKVMHTLDDGKPFPINSMERVTGQYIKIDGVKDIVKEDDKIKISIDRNSKPSLIKEYSDKLQENTAIKTTVKDTVEQWVMEHKTVDNVLAYQEQKRLEKEEAKKQLKTEFLIEKKYAHKLRFDKDEKTLRLSNGQKLPGVTSITNKEDGVVVIFNREKMRINTENMINNWKRSFGVKLTDIINTQKTIADEKEKVR